MLGHGYGFPSSHSQYMGFFSAFLLSHLYFRHRFASSGSRFLDQAWRGLLYSAIAAWSVSVAYSRYHLKYHTPHQIVWGFSIGVGLGLLLYTLAEYIPRRYPECFLGQFREWLLENPASTWIQIRDGWSVYSDGGREDEWKRWRMEREREKEERTRKRSWWITYYIVHSPRLHEVGRVLKRLNVRESL